LDAATFRAEQINRAANVLICAYEFERESRPMS
jgi:hypothetical protein